MKRMFLALALLLSAGLSQAELVVITHAGNSLNSLGASQLSRIFLGQTGVYPDGKQAIPLDVGGDSRNQFYRDVLKKSPAQIEKYWARMIFTGKAQPPREVRAAEVKALVAETPGAISYLERSKVDASVKILSIDTNQ